MPKRLTVGIVGVGLITVLGSEIFKNIKSENLRKNENSCISVLYDNLFMGVRAEKKSENYWVLSFPDELLGLPDWVKMDLRGYSDEQLRTMLRRDSSLLETYLGIPLNKLYKEGALIFLTVDGCGPCEKLRNCNLESFVLEHPEIPFVEVKNPFHPAARVIYAYFCEYRAVPSLVGIYDNEKEFTLHGFSESYKNSVCFALKNFVEDVGTLDLANHFEINLQLLGWDRQYEDFSKYTEEEKERRVAEEIGFFSSDRVPLEKLFDEGVFVYFCSPTCGACPKFKEHISNPFKDKKKCNTLYFWNTFDKEASGLYKLVCNGVDDDGGFLEGVPQGVLIKNKEIVYRVPGRWHGREEKIFEDLCSIVESWK